VASSPTAAAAAGLVAVFVSAIGLSIPHVGRFTPFGLDELAGTLALDQPTSDWLWSLLANVGLVLVVLTAAWLAFRRQEL
jgi:hypothetical protein